MKIPHQKIHVLINCLKNSVFMRFFMLMIVLLVMTALSTSHGFLKKGSWNDLRWLNKSSLSPASGEAMISRAEDIMKVFQQASVFNPPTGMRIVPLGEFHESIALPENKKGPERVSLQLGIRIPPEANRTAATLNVWINDPLFLLGVPVLKDKMGEIFMLPPLTGSLAGQTIYSRTAHPPGYEEKYPSNSMFPLWAHDIEPFLREVIRPGFKLARGTVTTIFTSGGKAFWKPVSQERWINAMIEKAKTELADFRSGIIAMQQSDVTTEQINQMKNYLERVRAMFDEKEIIARHNSSVEQAMSFYKMMKSTNPEEAEKYYRKTLEDSDKNLQLQLDQAEKSRAELEEYEDKLIKSLLAREDIWIGADASIKGGNWEALEETGRTHNIEKLIYLADAGRAISKLEAELNGLSIAERKAPAYGFELPPWNPLGTHKNVIAMPFEAERPSGLVDSNSKGARALVSLDPGFFNYNTDDASIGILGIEWSGYHKLNNPSGEGTMPHTVWSDLDWEALEAFID